MCFGSVIDSWPCFVLGDCLHLQLYVKQKKKSNVFLMKTQAEESENYIISACYTPLLYLSLASKVLLTLILPGQSREEH